MKKIYFTLLAILNLATAMAQVSVTATAGTTGPTPYATLNAAFGAINAGTHKGVIAISITGNTTEPNSPTALLKSGGTSDYTSISIAPAGGSRTVKSLSQTDNTAMIDLAGADNVTIDGDPTNSGTKQLTFEITPADGIRSAVFRLASIGTDGADGVQNNTIKNCIIKGGRFSNTVTTATYGIFMGGSYSAISVTNLTCAGCTGNNFENNIITRCWQGIVVSGTGTTFPAENTTIKRNMLGSSVDGENIGTIAISLTNCSSLGTGPALVEGNEVSVGAVTTSATSTAGSLRGISLAQGNAKSVIRANYVHDIIQTDAGASSSAYGIALVSSGTNNTGIRIENNFIRDVIATKTAAGSLDATAPAAFGIVASVTLTDLRINNNTIALLKQPAIGSSADYYTACVNLTNLTAAILSDFRNNNLINNNTGANAFSIRARAAVNVSSATMDYNNYKSAGTNLANYAGAMQTTLTGWQTASSKDANSLNEDPLFVSNTDLHLTASSPLIEKGTPIANITTDFDGDTRDATKPDIGADEYSTALPVSTLTLSGNRTSNGTKLGWMTVTETGNAGFEVLRSSNGTNFHPIGFVQTKATNGNSQSKLDYAFDDTGVPLGNLYYQLRQIDRSGKQRLSNIVLMKAGYTPEGFYGVFPNPATNRINLLAESKVAQNVTLVINDLNGRHLRQMNTTLAAGSNSINVDIQSLPAGNYVIQMLGGNGFETQTARFVKL